MPQPKILLVTHSQDNAAVQAVMDALNARGALALRLDTDLYPGEVMLTALQEGDRMAPALRLGAERHSLGDLHAVWYRRAAVGRSLQGQMEERYLRPAVMESREALFGLLETLPCHKLNDPRHHLRAERKPVQLALAARLGIAVPDTLVTNDPQEALAFCRAHAATGVVTKMMSSFAVEEDGQEAVVFTRSLRDVDVASLEGLEWCPMVFQARVPRALELRVTVVGRHVFASAMDDALLPQDEPDWRKKAHTLMHHWRPYTLPERVRERLLALMGELGLQYGAMDLILTPEGEHVFLEVNPGGEYYWQEAHGPRHGISAAIAEVLLEPSLRL